MKPSIISSGQWRYLAIGSVLFLGVACGLFTGGRPKWTIPGCTISSDSVRRLTRSQFVRWARGIDYDAQVDTQGRVHGSGTAGISVHRTRNMRQATRADLQDGCLIARVQATTAYPSLGLASGWNFVWADSTNPYTAVIVPEDPTVAVTEVNLGLFPREPAPGEVAAPRYICSDCGQDWCVYPRDGATLAPALFQSGAALRPPGAPPVGLMASNLAR